MSNHDEMVSVREAADRLGVSPGDVYRLIDARRLPAYRSTRVLEGLRIRLDDLEQIGR
jgi:excisionase family DNA binding protein